MQTWLPSNVIQSVSNMCKCQCDLNFSLSLSCPIVAAFGQSESGCGQAVGEWGSGGGQQWQCHGPGKTCYVGSFKNVLLT